MSNANGRLCLAMVMCFGIAGLSSGAEPKDQSPSQLLKIFRNEFVEIAPGKGDATKELRPFAIAKYEVPQNLYAAVAGNNPSLWRGPRNSVEMIDWDQAVAFCQKATLLMREAGLIKAEEEIRLPTEAEWEFCCRAGTQTAYSFGDDETRLGEYGWYHGNAAGNDPPVGALKPNPWGLHDVHGYLWEWCGDSVDADQRVMRGGAWTSSAKECRSDSRRLVERTAKGPDIGFRCVLARTQTPVQP